MFRLLAGSPTPSLHWRLPGGRTKEVHIEYRSREKGCVKYYSVSHEIFFQVSELVIPMVTRELGGSYRFQQYNDSQCVGLNEDLFGLYAPF